MIKKKTCGVKWLNKNKEKKSSWVVQNKCFLVLGKNWDLVCKLSKYQIIFY